MFAQLSRSSDCRLGSGHGVLGGKKRFREGQRFTCTETAMISRVLGTWSRVPIYTCPSSISALQ